MDYDNFIKSKQVAQSHSGFQMIAMDMDYLIFKRKL